ncbi:hypothetical protein M8J77_010961 [Diaphorina citri]|nr:hypothetical protein M8J77_010961 [Diaphorina citri]
MTKLDESKNIIFEDYEEDEIVSYEQWKTIVEIVNIKGTQKRCQKTVKEEITCTKRELVKDFQSQIGPFRQHCTNIRNQHNVISKMKEDLKETEVIFHFAFSENYNCKYANEIQSAHFGGSKKQISLHTTVVYTKIGDNRVAQSYCTLSEDLRHDPKAICAHLKPVIQDVKSSVKHLQSVHFISNGPVTQYRNKSMFQLWVKDIAKQLEAEEMTWNYTEAGHGKGAPDGVGGSAKRLFDNFVARGFDVPNLEKLRMLLNDQESSTKFFVVNEVDIVIIINAKCSFFVLLCHNFGAHCSIVGFFPISQ